MLPFWWLCIIYSTSKEPILGGVEECFNVDDLHSIQIFVIFQQPTLSDMTMYEMNFSLLVEDMLQNIDQPEYRQIIVEVCVLITKETLWCAWVCYKLKKKKKFKCSNIHRNSILNTIIYISVLFPWIVLWFKKLLPACSAYTKPVMFFFLSK